MDRVSGSAQIGIATSSHHDFPTKESNSITFQKCSHRAISANASTEVEQLQRPRFTPLSAWQWAPIPTSERRRLTRLCLIAVTANKRGETLSFLLTPILPSNAANESVQRTSQRQTLLMSKRLVNHSLTRNWAGTLWETSSTPTGRSFFACPTGTPAARRWP
jgi:hypothetical protein